jgi:hypothetical protein
MDKLKQNDRFASITDWVVTEKVHGSNFSFIVSVDEQSNKTVQVAKRTEIIPVLLLSNYYPAATKKVKERYEESAKQTFDYIQTRILDETKLLRISSKFLYLILT